MTTPPPGSRVIFSRTDCVRRVCLVAGALIYLNTWPVSARETEPHLLRVLQVKSRKKDDRPPVIDAVAIQPGGRLLAAAGDDHVVRLWHCETGRLLASLKGHTDWVRSATFSRNGEFLATAGADGRVLLWTLSSSRRPREILSQKASIAQIAFLPDPDRLLVIGFKTPLKLIDVSSGSVVVTRKCPCQDMRAIAVSPDGRFAAGGGRNGVIRIWSLPTCSALREIPAHGRRLRALAFSSDGELLVSAGEDRAIRVWEVPSGKKLMTLSSGPTKILAVAMVGKHQVASAGTDNDIRLWDLETQTQVGLLTGHDGSVAALASEDRLLISGSFDTTVRIWQLPKVDPLRNQAKDTSPPPTTVR